MPEGNTSGTSMRKDNHRPMTTVHDTTINVNRAGIFSKLQNPARCIRWNLEPDHTGRLHKVPVDAFDNHISFKSTEHWQTPDQILTITPDCTRLGYAIDAHARTFCIDFDGVVTDGVIAPAVEQFTKDHPGAWELSPSGTGIHGYFKGSLSKGSWSRKGKIELLGPRHFVTITGHRLPWSTDDLTDVEQGESQLLSDLATLAEDLGPREAKRKSTQDSSPIDSTKTSLRDRLAIIRGVWGTRLYDGAPIVVKSFASPSEAEWMLAILLAKLTEGDQDLITQAIRQSGLYKHYLTNRDHRIDLTVKKACVATGFLPDDRPIPTEWAKEAQAELAKTRIALQQALRVASVREVREACLRSARANISLGDAADLAIAQLEAYEAKTEQASREKNPERKAQIIDTNGFACIPVGDLDDPDPEDPTPGGGGYGLARSIGRNRRTVRRYQKTLDTIPGGFGTKERRPTGQGYNKVTWWQPPILTTHISSLNYQILALAQAPLDEPKTPPIIPEHVCTDDTTVGNRYVRCTSCKTILDELPTITDRQTKRRVRTHPVPYLSTVCGTGQEVPQGQIRPTMTAFFYDSDGVLVPMSGTVLVRFGDQAA